jgi:hypothetical protein
VSGVTEKLEKFSTRVNLVSSVAMDIGACAALRGDRGGP